MAKQGTVSADTSPPLNIRKSKDLLKEIFKHNIDAFSKGRDISTFVVPFFVGDPGVGKTAISRQAVKELQLELGSSIVVNHFQAIIAQYDPGELSGLPFVSNVPIKRVVNGKEVIVEEQRLVRLRPDFLPDIEDPTQSVGIFNLDELPQAVLMGQNVVSQLVNEWRIGHHKVSQGITMCCTGNRPENKAGTTPIPAHLKDRLMYIYVKADYEEWLRYAAGNGLNKFVRAYIRTNPAALSMFVPGADSCPTPRSWEKVSEAYNMTLENDIRLAAICGQVGVGEAHNIEAFVRLRDKLPDPDMVIANPLTAPILGNDQADVLHLLISSLADKTNKQNISNVFTYLDRLPNKEFIGAYAQDAFSRDPSLLQTKEGTDWKRTKVAELLF